MKQPKGRGFNYLAAILTQTWRMDILHKHDYTEEKKCYKTIIKKESIFLVQKSTKT